MQFFTEVEGYVLLKFQGVYREAPLMRNDKGELFAKRGSGLVRLMPHNSTTVNKLYWNEIKCSEEWQIFGCYLVLSSFVPASIKNKKAA